MNILHHVRRWLGQSECLEPAQLDKHSNDLVASLLKLAWFVEARDPYTGGHLWRVSRFAGLLAQAAGHDETDCARASLGGFLHDIGKVAVPDAILRKAGALNEQEMDVIRTHPGAGSNLLAGHPLAELVRDAVLLHHERPDGTGYPHGMPGADIPVVARIVGIGDAFDAMTSRRPYRNAMGRDAALTVIAAGRGTQFDPALADLFVALGHAGQLDHTIGHSDDGIPLHDCPHCGPTLVRHSGHRPGEHIYCGNCHGQFELREQGGVMQAHMTGRSGAAADLVPPVDADLIARSVRALTAALPVGQLLQLTAQGGAR